MLMDSSAMTRRVERHETAAVAMKSNGSSKRLELKDFLNDESHGCKST